MTKIIKKCFYKICLAFNKLYFGALIARVNDSGVRTSRSAREIFPSWFKRPDILPDTDIWTLFNNISGFLMTIAVPLSTIFYIWAAFLYLTAGGNEKKIQTANKAVIYTTIGLAVILSAHALAAIAKDVFSVPPAG